jgi:hypothetical protein
MNSDPDSCAMSSFEVRKMVASDLDGVFSILCNVATSIPVLLNTEKRRQAMFAHIQNRYLRGFSLVAADREGAIVGLQLADRKRIFADVDAICLDYSGVRETARQIGIFREFIKRQQQHGLLLRAEVLSENTSDMAEMLKRYGFSCNGKTEYLWRPNTHSAPAELGR